MNLFKLVGSIFVDNEEANKSISKTDSKAESLAQKFVKGATTAAKWGAAVATAAVGMATAAGAAIVKVAEDTREYRSEMGKLETAFESSDHSAETAKKTYQELQSILGDTGQSVEAANHLAKLCKNQEQLSKWTNICTGVYAQFGASLPIEGLTEAANETAKTGALTGGLADALNWAGVNEEKFQEKLDKCKTEQQRQALITETLNGLYAESAKLYRENSEAVIAANASQEKLNETMAKIGGAVEPVVTKVKAMGITLLEMVTPAIVGFAGEVDEMATSFLEGHNPIQGIIDRAKKLYTWITDMGSYMEKTLHPVLGDLNAGFTTVKDAVDPLIDKCVEYVSSGELVEDITAKIKAGIDFLADSYVLAKEFLNAFVAGLPDYITNGELAEDATALLKDSVQFLSDIFQTIQGVLQPYIDMLSEYVTSGRAAEDITKAVEAAVEFLKTSYENLLEFIGQVVQGFQDAIQWGREHETVLSVMAIAIGTLTTAIGAYNVAMAIKNAGGIVEIAQLAATAVGVWALDAAEAAHTVTTTIATAATTAFGAAVSFLTSPITLVVLAIGALIAAGVALYQNWDVVTEKASNLWKKITDIFDKIKQSITDKIDSAKETVKNIVDDIKEFFNFKVSLPKIKLPHFSIKPKGWELGDLLKGSIPKLGIEWYAKAMDKGMIMESPTVFGVNGNKLMAGGEAGSETVVGTESLMDMIRSSVSNENTSVVQKLEVLIAILSRYMPEIVEAMKRAIVLDTGVMIGQLIPVINTEFKNILDYEERGNQ